MNELIFVAHAIIVAGTALGALVLGPSALVAFVCTCCVLANLFVLKQITLFGFAATCADAFTIGATIGLNLLQEYFGASHAKRAIVINFFILIFYAIVSQIHLIYIPSSSDEMHFHFMPLLNFMPRIIIASLFVYYISQLADYYFYGLLKRIFHHTHIIFRNYVSIALCQLLDTILFSFLGLYGIINNIGEIIIISYLIKLISIFIAIPFVAFSRKIYNYVHNNHI
ncbi:MAG TPA: queuosine precursor transporter [Candidatus Babeliales bacterium]|nr:queuosine precursor transporter [Candidatus Babeliales bacterium]